jgi:prevent-host-death family protein
LDTNERSSVHSGEQGERALTTLSISQARKQFLDLPEKLARDPEHAICVTRHGRPKLAVIPWELYESCIETLEVLSEPDLVAALRKSIKDIERARLLNHKEVGARLGFVTNLVDTVDTIDGTQTAAKLLEDSIPTGRTQRARKK